MSEQHTRGEFEAPGQTVRSFETILRASTDGVVITNATQDIVVVNETFCALFGRHWRDVVETSLFVWLEQLDAGAPEGWSAIEHRAHLEGASYDVEFQVASNGRVRHLSVNASPQKQMADHERGIIISI